MSKSLTRTNKVGNSIVLAVGEMVDVGVDTHKDTYDISLWSDERQGVVSRWVQPANAQALVDRLVPCQDRVRRIVYEAGPTGYALVRLLRAAGFRADVIAPSSLPRPSGSAPKSDRIDSAKLAKWSSKQVLRAVHVPSEEEEGDRQIFRIRGDAVNKCVAVKAQIRSFLLVHAIGEPGALAHWSKRGIEALGKLALSPQLRFALDILLDDLAHCQAQVRKTNAALRDLGAQARHCDTVAALRTVPGVGPVTAMALRTELIAPGRFNNSREVASMVGLAPLVQSSGKSRHEGPLMRTGNKRLRAMLTEASWRWIAQDAGARARYAHLIGNTGDRKKALSAMARRLLIILWHIALSGEPYRPTSPPAAKEGQPGLKDAKKATKEAPRGHAPRRLSSIQSPR